MKILMVCLGNICRSPLAEGLMQHHIEQTGLDWTVDSAGTGGWHVGNSPDRRSVQVARLKGIDISRQRCRQFTRADFADFDRIYVMDMQNYRDVLRLAVSDADRAKVELILDVVYPGQQQEVPDPYYDDDGFEAVFEMLDKACAVIISQYR
jgi:protein-tyrosine phosphatase